MRLELVEEVALAGEQALEPGEHGADPRLGGGDDAEPLGRGLELGGAERADEVGEVGLLDHLGGVVERHPAALALGLFLPVVELAVDRQREHVDIDHQRGAVALALAVAVAAQRGRADQPAHAGLLVGLQRGGGVRLRDPDGNLLRTPLINLGTSLVVSLASDPTRSVVVRINDTGPLRPGRILDLSPAAMKALTGKTYNQVSVNAYRCR